MKKLAIFFLVSILYEASYAQSQRLVLVEEFTGETCPPCAANNPAFNSLLDANEGKVVSIKYQNDIPSAGPNYYSYNTADVENRQTYYGNTSSPSGILDGNVHIGNITTFNQTRIDNRAAVSSPFTITVSHSFSANYDSIYTTTTVTASEAVSSPNLKLRIAVTERDLYGYTAPNGEREFSHVMRKMLPNAGGIDLPDDWAVGQTETYEAAWLIKVPTSATVDMPVWAMLEVVSFVQNDTGKEVMQAGISHAVLTADLALVGLSTSAITCDANLEPSITVKNLEATAITSFDVEYTLDAGTPVVYSWTGNLASGATTTVSLPSSPLSAGSHKLNVKITNINGQPDLVSTNNSLDVGIGSPIPTANITQNFVNPTWPPTNWINVNPDDGAGWTRSNSGINGVGSAKMDFYNSTAGNIDMLYIVTALDLSTAASAKMRFDLAHRRYSANESDRLEIQASNDCGQNWVSVFNKAGAELATVTTFSTSAFTPTATQWREEMVDLNGLVGNNQVLFRIKATSDYGNNAYIDNINTLITSSIDDLVTNAQLDVYPNPASQNLTLAFGTRSNAEVGVLITNSMGQVVEQISPYQLGVGSHKLQIPVAHLANGLYFATLRTEEGLLSTPFTIAR